MLKAWLLLRPKVTNTPTGHAKSRGQRSCMSGLPERQNTSRSCECSGAIPRTVGLPTPHYSGHLHVVSNKLLSTTNRQFASLNAEHVHNRLKHTALLHDHYPRKNRLGLFRFAKYRSGASLIPRATRISNVQTTGKYIFYIRRALRPSFHRPALNIHNRIFTKTPIRRC